MSDVDVAGYWLCRYPDYAQISTLSVLEGSTTIPPGGYLVVAFEDLGEGDGEVGLYTTDADFSNAANMVDYMEYGSAGHTRAEVGVAAGVWDDGVFAAAPAEGQTLAFVGAGSDAALNWRANAPTPGAGNGADPSSTAVVEVDRFSDEAGTLFVRDDANGLPAANEPVDFDQGPFITQGLTPGGDVVRYYNFDVQSTDPAPIYVLFHEGSDTPVPGQLNLVNVVPGDVGYNDFWEVMKVTVPANYVANTITSVETLMMAGFPMEETSILVNCPVVPEGSTASMRLTEGNDAGLVQGWYQDEVVYYFEFGEAMLMTTGAGQVPRSPIYVAFNINPDEEGGGPPSGFLTETDGVQTHNVLATVPGEEAYSPLWAVNIYDNAEFEDVMDLTTAQAATLLVPGAADVNCPVVAIESATAIERRPGEAPSGYLLHANYPNPFNPETTITYEIDVPGLVRLSVFDTLGRKVVDLVAAPQSGGVYRVTWDGRDANGRAVGSGAYLYRLALDGQTSQTRIMTLLK
jgi:hypothetical protein